MAITFDNHTTSATQSGNSSHSYNTHTRGAGDNAIAIGMAWWQDTTPGNLSTFTVNSASPDATLATNLTAGGAGASTFRVAAFMFKNPPAGTLTAAVTFSETINTYRIGLSTYLGVDQTTTIRSPFTNVGSSSPVTVTVTDAVTGDWVIDAAVIGNTPGTTVGADQQQRLNTTPGAALTIVQSDQLGSAGGVMSWAIDAAQFWATIAVALIPATALQLTPTVGAGSLSGIASIMDRGLFTRTTIRGQN